MYDGGRGGVLTAKQMRGYLERVLRKSENWTVYGTALLEHAWLECEHNHRRERNILQIQALDNQYTHRLTLTQSTFESAVYTSAPPGRGSGEYTRWYTPLPRSEVLRDLAERYTIMGALSSAADLYKSLELWDEAVEYHRAAGRGNNVECIVRGRI